MFTRRELFVLFAAIAAGACSKENPSTRSAAPTTAPTTTLITPTTNARGTATPASCVLAPEQTEGPYYIAGEPTRSDVTEGRPGIPLRLDLTVALAANCAPVRGATVEIWHADAGGDYSGFGDGASSRTFLRGAQTAGDDGKVVFRTIYPGWYQGRAVHIHVKVHTGGATIHTGQLYFDDDISREVYARAPYNVRAGQWLTNSQDGIYRNGGAQSTLSVGRDGDGYAGRITLGIRQ